jgi:hypothetical protein
MSQEKVISKTSLTNMHFIKTFFDTRIDFLKKEKNFALISASFKLWLKMHRKRLKKKTENLFL